MKDSVIVKCTLCDSMFYHTDFNEANAADTCACGNIHMGIVVKKNNRYPYYVTVSYEKEKPELYQTNKKGDIERL